MEPSRKVRRWASIYHSWWSALKEGDGETAQRLMNQTKHAWLDVTDESDRNLAWGWYLKLYCY